jgi:hypothetical protein
VRSTQTLATRWRDWNAAGSRGGRWQPSPATHYCPVQELPQLCHTAVLAPVQLVPVPVLVLVLVQLVPVLVVLVVRTRTSVVVLLVGGVPTNNFSAPVLACGTSTELLLVLVLVVLASTTSQLSLLMMMTARVLKNKFKIPGNPLDIS